MSAPAPTGRAQIVTLLLKGFPVDVVAARLHYTEGHVADVRQALVRAGIVPPVRQREAYAPWVPPDPREADRQAALERGRRLALAKVAAGEWVLPRDGEVEP